MKINFFFIQKILIEMSKNEKNFLLRGTMFPFVDQVKK